MSVFGGADLTAGPGLRVTTKANGNGLRTTPAVPNVASTTIHKNNINPANGKPKLDTSDPRVRKLVYSMYRDMLTTYNDEANDFVSQKDPSRVKQDLGVGPILETIIVRQGSQQGGSISSPSIDSPDISNSTSTPSSVCAAPIATGGMPPPPPPPPLIPSGAIPAVRLNSEIGPRDKGPPMALANAMMKDKKPFTYTPGGIDLSEIRSPRMAKRIQMNAAAEGVTSAPEPRPAPAPPPGGCLPPAALAAMQPQMAIPVFPQGGFNPGSLHKTHKPSDFAPPPPPGPPPFMQQLQQNFNNQNRQQSPPPTRTPPPPPVRSSTPTTMPVRSPTPTTVPVRSPSPSVAVQMEYRPVSNNNHNLKIVTNNNIEDRSSPTPTTPVGVGTGRIYIPPIETSNSAPAPQVQPAPQKPIQTKAQAHSQNLGSIYIPPIEQRSNERNQGTASSSSSGASDSPAVRSVTSPPTVGTPMTPLLNKAPTPWMNSYNRMQNQPPTTPPYVNPANIITPWGVVGAVRNIPISMAEDENDNRNNAGANMGVRSVVGPQTGNARMIPIHIQREDSLSHQQQQQQQQFQQQQYQQQLYQQQQQQQQQQTGTRTIPIQMEGVGRPPPLGNQMPSNQQANLGYQKRIVPAPYNNPMGLYSNQNAAEAYHKQAGEIHGMDRMSVSDDNRRADPIQSKSLRVIQKVAEDELQRHEQLRMELMGDDKQLMDLFKAQVDEGSSLHQSEEPRFRGGHIPSRAFRVLQSNLPPSPGGQDQAPNYQTQAQNAKGNLTHNIQILMQSQPQSPTPQQQQTYQHNIQVQPESPGASGNRLPPSQQKVPEPKKYMGSNIPSRSFKILQAMTAEDESSASESEGAPADQCSYSSDENTDTSPYPYPYPYTFCNSNGQDPNNEQGQGYSNSEYPQWPENFEGDPNWDPYNYMSWYYWWYYNSCYWNGYDMSGYEYPANWDPNYYPEGYSTDYSGYETGTEPYNQQAPEENVPIPSKSFKNLQKSYNDDDDMLTTGPDVPKIVIEGETCPSLNETETENTYLTKPDSRNIKMNACDKAKNVVHRIEELDEDSSSEDEDDYESCVEEQMVIKSETGSESNKGTENIEKNLNKTDVDDEDDEEDEETEPEDDDGDEGIVEEPETPSSEDSDAATLVDEVCYDRSSRMSGLTIEEYQSPTSDSCDSFFDVGRKNRLSTIEELTENERSRASSVLPRNLSQELELEREPLKEESEDEDDEDSESDSEDLSSVSVIENKSDTQGEVTTATESKREDETTSSDEDGDVEDDDGNDVAAVTVRLPLKLSFSKSKSYRDIATVLVCDSEVCSETETVENDSRVSQVMEVREVTEDGCDLDGNEPAVSYTISLSRSTSKNKDEEVVKNVTIHTDDKQDQSSKCAVTVEESPDIDFWSQLGSSEEEKTKDFWETKKTSEERKSNDFSSSNPTSDYEPVSNFWGSLHKEKTRLDESSKDIDFWATTSEVVEEDSCKSAAKEEVTEPVEDYWGTINNSKSEEIVREKSDFASSEAKKSVSWDRQDSIDYKWDNEFNFWDKSSKSVETRRFSSNFEISEAYESDSGMRSETRKKKVDRVHHKRHSIHGSIWDTIKNMKQAAAAAAEEKNKLEDESKKEEVSPPWMYWENAEKEKANEIEKTTEKVIENQNDEDSSSDDDDDDDNVGANKDMNISVDVNLAPEDSESESEEEEDEDENNINDPSQFNGMLVAAASRNDITKATNNSTCQSDIEVTLSLNSRLSPAPHVSDENSDESSSKSSGTTIGRDKSDPERSDGMKIIENTSSRIPKPLTTESLPKSKETQAPKDEESQKTERPVEIRELKEKIKLSESSDLNGHEEDEACTCHLADRMARAEGLLWRIERFLQESLSLGSEDDSGVMTDLSRQISDVDTDADNDNNDNEFLLTAAFAAKQKRSSSSRNLANKESSDAGAGAANAEVHQPTCARNPNQNQQAQPKKRPTSEILVESYSKRETEVETETVKMRSASERKALRYQRAKTHSRLFQLLQDECSKEDDDDDDDYDYETETGIAPESQVVEKVIPIETEQSTASKDSTTTTTTTTTTNASKEERRSRLIPLPIKNFLTSSLPCDSNSSPSGSSGVLSPTSPVNRDQLLADIINEFHLRHQQQNQKRLSNFPSKIFKLLQQEFGEEFYETFDCCADDDGFHIPVSVDGNNKHCQGEALVQECTIHKSESLKLLEESAATKCSGSTSLKSKEKSTNHCRKSNNATSKCKSDSNTSSSHRTAATAITPEVTDALSVISAKDSKFLEVPLRRKKANLNRDPRSPRTKKC